MFFTDSPRTHHGLTMDSLGNNYELLKIKKVLNPHSLLIELI